MPRLTKSLKRKKYLCWLLSKICQNLNRNHMLVSLNSSLNAGIPPFFPIKSPFLRELNLAVLECAKASRYNHGFLVQPAIVREKLSPAIAQYLSRHVDIARL